MEDTLNGNSTVGIIDFWTLIFFVICQPKACVLHLTESCRPPVPPVSSLAFVLPHFSLKWFWKKANLWYITAGWKTCFGCLKSNFSTMQLLFIRQRSAQTLYSLNFLRAELPKAHKTWYSLWKMASRIMKIPILTETCSLKSHNIKTKWQVSWTTAIIPLWCKACWESFGPYPFSRWQRSHLPIISIIHPARPQMPFRNALKHMTNCLIGSVKWTDALSPKPVRPNRSAASVPVPVTTAHPQTGCAPTGQGCFKNGRDQ